MIDTFDSMDDKWGCWKSLLLSVLDQHAPLRKIRERRSSLPWITAEVLKINRARNYFRRKIIIIIISVVTETDQTYMSSTTVAGIYNPRPRVAPSHSGSLQP